MYISAVGYSLLLLRWTQQQQFETGELFILILYPLFSFKKVVGFSSVRVLLSEKLIPCVRACASALVVYTPR